MTENPYVRLSIENRTAILTIDRPPANALHSQVLLDLAAAFDKAIADPAVKVIIITGAGRLFAAGADIGELDEVATAEEAHQIALRGQALLDKIEASPKPVIAAINGCFALGGGNELAMACHIRIAEESVRFGQPEITLGIMPGWGGTQRLPRLVGGGRALELLLTGAQISAQEACQIGLVNRVVPAGTALEEAKRMAETIGQFGAKAISAILSSVAAGLAMSPAEGLRHEAEQFAKLFETEDKREGFAAFRAKRPPQFRDS